MRGPSRLLTWTLAGSLLLGAASAGLADDCLRPPRRPAGGAAGSLADLGEIALERLPGDAVIVRANLSAHRPVAVAGCYLMREDLLVVSETGMVYCMKRRDLTPRWVAALKAPLFRKPAEGPTHYTFLVKAYDGTYWIHAVSKRNGVEAGRFPVRLPYAASAGVANDASHVWVGSLGSPRDNRTLESMNLVTGRQGWGWRTRGILWASPVLDPQYRSLVIAGEDGAVISLPVGGGRPASPNWVQALTGPVMAAPAVTPSHVVVGSQDGILRCLDLGSGGVLWLEGLDASIRTSPWVLGGMTRVERPSGVDGAPSVSVDVYTGIAFARNRHGLFAHDLETGTRLFHDPDATARPVCRRGRYVMTMNRERTLVLRDAENGYEVSGRLDLRMFDLVPTNSSDGAVYGCTHDGGLVATIPGR